MNELEDHILLKYLKKECTEEELQIINEWMNESEENVSYLFSLEELYDSVKLNRYTQKATLDKAEKQLRERIEQLTPKQRPQLRVRNLMKYVAVFILLLGIGGIIYHQVDNNAVFQFQDEIVQTSMSSVKEILLPDSTRVWLNQSAIIRYPESFQADTREVFLEGEAYFEVSKDKTKPFIVHTDALQVKVLGTSFNLKCQEGSNIAEASLIEGTVEVKSKNSGGQIVLSPGQKAELDQVTGQLQVKQVNTKLDAVWHNGLIPFEQANLHDIAKTLERFYDVEIVLAPNIDSCTYSGVIHRREGIDSVLNSLKNSIPISYEINRSKIYINRAR